MSEDRLTFTTRMMRMENSTYMVHTSPRTTQVDQLSSRVTVFSENHPHSRQSHRTSFRSIRGTLLETAAGSQRAAPHSSPPSAEPTGHSCPSLRFFNHGPTPLPRYPCTRSGQLLLYRLLLYRHCGRRPGPSGYAKSPFGIGVILGVLSRPSYVAT